MLLSKTPELASYGKLSEITGKTYRTLKKLLSEAYMEPVEVRPNAILFDRLAAIEALEMPDGNDLDVNLTALVLKERLRAAYHGNTPAAALRAARAEILETLYQITQDIDFEISFLPAHLIRADPRLKLSDAQIDGGQDPFSELRILVDRCSAEFRRARGVRILKPSADPNTHCRMVFDKYSSIVSQALNDLQREVAASGINFSTGVISMRVARARHHVEKWRTFF